MRRARRRGRTPCPDVMDDEVFRRPDDARDVRDRRGVRVRATVMTATTSTSRDATGGRVGAACGRAVRRTVARSSPTGVEDGCMERETPRRTRSGGRRRRSAPHRAIARNGRRPPRTGAGPGGTPRRRARRHAPASPPEEEGRRTPPWAVAARARNAPGVPPDGPARGIELTSTSARSVCAHRATSEAGRDAPRVTAVRSLGHGARLGPPRRRPGPAREACDGRG